jgi:hypothetical protein
MKKFNSKPLGGIFHFIKRSEDEIKTVATPTLMFVSFRLLMLALSISHFYIWLGDYRWVKEILLPAFEAHGIWNVWTGYFPLTTVLLYLVLSVLDFASLHLISLIFDTGNLLLIYGIGKRFLGKEKAAYLLWVYSSIFITIQWWILPLVEQNATFFLLLSLYLLLLGKRKLSAIAGGIGAVIKIFPAVTTLTYLKTQSSQRAKISYLTILISIILLFSLPFLINNPAIFISGFLWQANRPPWETIWAIASFGAKLRPGLQPKYSEIVRPVSPNPELSLIDLITLAGLIVTLSFIMLKVKLNTDYDKVRFTAVVLCLFLFWGKGWSPQYSVWITPLLLLLYPNFRGLMLLIVWEVVNCLQYPYAFTYFYPALLIICIIIRTVIIAGVIITQTRQLVG